MKNPNKKDLFVFLGIWAGIFAVFLIFGFFKHGIARDWAIVGIIASVVLMFIPKLSTPLYKAWVKVGEAIGFVVSRSILALLFFGIFTPLGLIFRFFGRDVLEQKFADKATFFKARATPPGTMKNQF